MAVTMLGCLHSDVINGKLNSISNFVEGRKGTFLLFIFYGVPLILIQG